MTRFLSCVILFGFLLAGCDGVSEEEPPLVPGTLGLASISSTSSADNVFDLGELKSTKSFNFYLTNKGDTDIFDVHIESSNPGFVVDPSFMAVIPVGENLLLEQALQLTALHGVDAGGLGPVAPMEMGLNETDLRIRAKTTDAAGDTVSIGARATMQVNAQLAALQAFDVEGEIDLGLIRGSISGLITPFQLGRIVIADGNVRLVNTGNVDVVLKVFQRPVSGSNETTESEEMTLSPSEELTIERAREVTLVRVDTDFTITDATKMPFQQDGYVYLVFDIDRSL